MRLREKHVGPRSSRTHSLGGRAGPESWEGFQRPSSSAPSLVRRSQEGGTWGGKWNQKGGNVRKLGGDVWRRGLGGGKGGIFLFFILYCSEVTEFVSCTAMFSLRKQQPLLQKQNNQQEKVNRNCTTGAGHGSVCTEPGEAWLRLLRPDPWAAWRWDGLGVHFLKAAGGGSEGSEAAVYRVVGSRLEKAGAKQAQTSTDGTRRQRHSRAGVQGLLSSPEPCRGQPTDRPLAATHLASPDAH